MEPILRYDILNVIKRSVYDLYMVHGDTRGHTGATMSLSCRSVNSMLKKQKNNTRISTESEIIKEDDALLSFLCV